MPTIAELGRKVKAKYPGIYDDLSDQDLGQRVKNKYPNAYNDFTDGVATSGQEAQGGLGGTNVPVANLNTNAHGTTAQNGPSGGTPPPSTSAPVLAATSGTSGKRPSIIAQQASQDPTGNNKLTQALEQEMPAIKPQIENEVSNQVTPEQNFNNTVDAIRPIADAIATAGGTALALPSGPLAPVAGIAAGTGTDLLLQRLKSNPSQTPIKDAAENIVGNELGGAILGPVIGKAKAVLNELNLPGSVVGKIAKLQPTYSQYFQKTFGKNTPSKWIEDVFQNGVKSELVQKAADKTTVDLGKVAAKYAGRNPNTVANPENMAQLLKMGAESQLAKSEAESNAQANVAKTIAKANPIPIQRSGLNSLAPLTTPGPNQTVVEGPINMSQSIQAAQNYLLQQQQLFGKSLSNAPDERKPLIAAAQNLLDASGAIFNSQGELVRSNPVSFEDAWNFKKAADQLGNKVPLFRQFAYNINSDIDNSIPKWQNNPQEAMDAWKNAKATVAQRKAVFEDDGLQQLIDTTNSPIPQINNIISDPEKLDRALKAGELKLPSGKVESSNMKGDLQAYYLMKALQDSQTVDPISQKVTSIDMKKLTNAFTDPANKNVVNKLYSKSELNNLLSNLSDYSKVNEPVIGRPIGNKLQQLIRGVGYITVPLVAFSGHLTPFETVSGGIAAVEMSQFQLAKLMTNPKLARLAAASGMTPIDFLRNPNQEAGKIIAGILRGSTVSFVGPQGNKVYTGVVQDDGKVK